MWPISCRKIRLAPKSSQKVFWVDISKIHDFTQKTIPPPFLRKNGGGGGIFFKCRLTEVCVNMNTNIRINFAENKRNWAEDHPSKLFFYFSKYKNVLNLVKEDTGEIHDVEQIINILWLNNIGIQTGKDYLPHDVQLVLSQRQFYSWNHGNQRRRRSHYFKLFIIS